jgi:hypothetical protein
MLVLIRQDESYKILVCLNSCHGYADWHLLYDLRSYESYFSFRKANRIHQYSETNVMHFLFNLSRIKGLYMFRALLAHPQQALHKRHLVYCVRVMTVCCTRTGVELVSVQTPVPLQSWWSQLTKLTYESVISTTRIMPSLHNCYGARGGAVVEALRYKPEGRGIDSRWCHWNFSLT